MKVVFDLDGTLANAEKRVNQYLVCPKMGYPHKRTDKIDWDGFFMACDEDKPIVPTLLTLHAMHEMGHTVEIWTGRSDIAREKTEHWLLMHGTPHDIIKTMKMRPAKERMDDDKLKYQWGQEYGMPTIVFEDRNRVVDMWRSHGVIVYHVAPGDF